MQKSGRPRKIEVRRYKKEETGTRTFHIEDLEAEIVAHISANHRGTLYIGTEYGNHDVIVLVLRNTNETGNV